VHVLGPNAAGRAPHPPIIGIEGEGFFHAGRLILTTTW
jgi:hypothetical protein